MPVARPWAIWGHVGGLWALIVAHPLLNLLGKSPEFFVAHRASPTDILLLVILLCAVLPGLLASGISVAGVASTRARAWALYAVLAALLGLLGMQLAVRAGAATWPAAVAFALLAVGGIVQAYRAWAPVRSFFSALSIATLVVPALFLSKPGVRTLVWAPSHHAPVGGTSPGGRAVVRHAPVVLVIFDELPLISLLDAERNIDAALYPHLAALAADGVWFRNATTVDDFTKYAVPAILSGRYPSEAALPIAADHPGTLFTLLEPTHHLKVSETVTALCPARLCTPSDTPPLADRLAAVGRDLRVVFLRLVLTSDLTEGLPDPSANWANFDTSDGLSANDPDGRLGSDDGDGKARAEAVRHHWRQGMDAARVAPVMRFIDGIHAGNPQPTFYFLHTLISHQPHHMLPNGKENRTWTPLPGRMGWNRSHAWTVSQHYQRHLLQAGYVDYLAGRLIGRLKSAALYDDAIVVITADHGISYLPDAPQRNFTDRTAAEIMRVPLIVKFPKTISVTQHRSDANVESIDVAPTIAEAAGVRIPWPIDGRSLIDAQRPLRAGKRLFFGDERHWRSFAATEPDPGPALAHKLALFGASADNRQRAPLVPEFHGLIGRPLSAMRVVDGGPSVEIARASEFAQVDLRSSAVVFDVSGRFASPRRDGVVAVAINGVVEAVTRTWESNPRGWLATPRFGAWHQGWNRVDVLLVERDGQLRRCADVKSVRPADLNLISASARDWGIGQTGLYSSERSGDGTEFRWTRDRAELTNLVAPERTRAVKVDVFKVPGNAPKLLKIEADECVVFRGLVGSGWSSELSLQPCHLSGGQLRLRFTTAAARVATDSRQLGVALSRVTLH